MARSLRRAACRGRIQGAGRLARNSTATGSRALDLLIFAAVLAWMLAAAPGLRVYYRVTPTRVSVVAVGPDGARTALATPEPLAGVGRAPWRARQRILEFAGSEAGRGLGSPGGRLEWTIHYSKNSLRFDRTRSVETPVR